jgi:hypothetical protein
MSDLRVGTISDAAGTGPVTLTGQYAAKAWVNFNGTGTVAIKDSANTSSVTDNTTGSYTQNFTNAFTDTNYIAMGSVIAEYDAARGNKGLGIAVEGDESISSQTTGAVKMYSNSGSTGSSNGGADDFVPCFVHCIGDLA